MRFLIPINKLEDLKKKLNRIEKKCPNVIKYEELGYKFEKQTIREVFFNGKYSELKTNGQIVVKCMEIEVEGSYCINDWKFVATLEHTENGNIIRNISDIEIPEYYRTCSCYCEHCNTKRNRKDTYLIRNINTGEFKQVGKNCLMEYTCGLDSQVVSAMMSFQEYIILSQEMDEEMLEYFASQQDNYMSIEIFKNYAYEEVLQHGYIKDKTVSNIIEKIKNGEKIVNHSVELAKIDEWLKEQDLSSEYMYNANIAWNNSYCEYRDYALIASLINVYLKSLNEKIQRNTAKLDVNVGDRITFNVISIRVVFTSWDFYSDCENYLYEIIDDKGYTYTWNTTKKLENTKCEMTATVKGFKEYKGINQVVIQRAKVKVNKPVVEPEYITGKTESEKALDELFKM